MSYRKGEGTPVEGLSLLARVKSEKDFLLSEGFTSSFVPALIWVPKFMAFEFSLRTRELTT
jgi:hypothetical protein